MAILIVDENDTNKRLDIYLTEKLGFSRNHISNVLKQNKVYINNNIINKSSYKLKQNDNIEFNDIEPITLDVTEENIPLNIIYEDDDILIIDKPKGMVVHPSNGHYNGTLVNAIMYHCKNKLSSINGVIRPGIVHRIDKDTSGILCICKNDKAHQNISNQFKEHTNIRKYKTIVKGVLNDDEGIIDKPIGRDKKNRLRMAIDENGKNAITKYKVIERFNNYTFVECELFTGRTHQIRVHMKSIGHPVLGDLLYGSDDNRIKFRDGQILHAFYLSFIHPNTNKKVEFISELPKYFVDILEKIRKIN